MVEDPLSWRISWNFPTTWLLLEPFERATLWNQFKEENTNLGVGLERGASATWGVRTCICKICWFWREPGLKMVSNMIVYQYAGQTVAFWFWIHREKVPGPYPLRVAAEEELVSWLFDGMWDERKPLPLAVDCNGFPIGFLWWRFSRHFLGWFHLWRSPFFGHVPFRVLGWIQQARIDENLLLETSDSCSSDLFVMEASLSFGVVQDEGEVTPLDWKIYDVSSGFFSIHWHLACDMWEFCLSIHVSQETKWKRHVYANVKILNVNIKINTYIFTWRGARTS